MSEIEVRQRAADHLQKGFGIQDNQYRLFKVFVKLGLL